MDNPEYLRSIIQKLKLEIKMLKEANAARGASGDVTPIPASESQKSPTSNRHSIASGSTMVQGSDDSTNEDRALSPSPSRKLHHYRSRDSISTDISHGYLDAVHEEDDRFSDTSSSARNTMDSLRFSSINGASPKQRPSLMPLTIPPSADSMASFQEFVEPVIEEYEKVIAGLENHLSRTQENLNTAELMLEERQGRIEVIEDENKVLLRQHEERKSQIAMIEDENRVLLQQQRERQASEAKNDALQQQQKELEQQLQKLQEQLIEVESRKAKSEEYAHELESKLQQEKEAAEERVRQALKEKELEVQSSRSLSPVPSNAAKEMELKQLADRILRLEEQYQHQQQETDAEADAIRSAQVAQGESSESAFESDGEREEREARETKREELLVEKLQSKAVLEQELEAEKARHEALLLEIKASKTPSVDEKDSIHTDEDVHDEGMIEHLGVSIPMHDEATNAFVKHLESELAHALEEIAILKEKLEQLQRDYGAALEMEEMLRAAVTELEERLKNSEETNALNLQRIQELEEQSTKAEQESKSSQEIYATNLLRIQELEERSTKAEQEVKSTQEVHATNLEKLEHSLQRIQELEERSTKAELESLKLVEELKVKLTGADSAAEARLADEMLDLLQEMDQERSKVKELQAQVENYLAALAAEKSRADELESDRDAIRSQWDADKSRIQVLEKKIEDLSTQALQNAELIASLEEMISQHEGTEATKLQLEQELSQRILEHDEALASKAALIQELEQRVQELELSLQSTESDAKEQVARAEDELSEALTMLMESQEKEQEQQKALQELQDKVAALDAEAAISRDALADKDNEYAEVLLALESKIKVAEADRDDAETRLEDAERRHEAVKEEMMSVKDEIKVKQTSIDEHLAAIELLQNKVTELQSQSLPSSRPLSASSSVGTLAASDDPGSVIQKLEQEKARYRALVRLNEKEIERLNQDLEALANDFMKAAADSEDAEDEMRARIAELEALVDERNSKPNNLSSTSLNRLQASSGSHQAQLTTLKAERDEALKSSEQLSAIVAELNEQNHTLQEKFFTLERDHESLKLQQVMESQAYQDEIRGLRERADRMDRNGSPSPVGGLHHLDDVERVLRHKASYSSEHRGEDSLATPRQSWNTTASTSQHANANAQGRPGRHESTLIQQAKYIKMLEEKVAELQGGSNGDGPKFTPLASAAALGLNIHHKSSDPELSRSVMQRHSAEKVSPAMRNLATFASGHAAPSTPPPTTPLPPPPSIATAPKNAPHPSASAAPPSPRIGSGPQLDVSPNSSPRLRPSRAGSNASRTMVSPSPNGAQSGRRERDSTSSNASESNNGWTSPAGSTAAGNSNISAATAQALQGVEVNELRGVVDTLAHQVQALKVDQTMQQGKIQRLEAALADAEERLKRAQGERDTITTEKDSLTKELEQLRAELASAKVKADKERATLESKIEREKKEREKVMEIHTLMEAKVEERISRKSKFRCI
ncbi:hypothetical protein B0O80DRAFT_60927 [Mortierella sp. GBAus27b]|nr:hypothetical protein B0O80DRAFT_60927 [Mortierella sp. GBAus27b]